MTQEQVQPEAAAPKDWWSSGVSDRRPTQVTVPTVTSRRPNAFLPTLMIAGGVVAAVGSTLPWVSARILGHTYMVDGTDHAISTAISVNGWVTLAGGATVALLGALMIISGERALRWLGIVLSLATTGFAVYDIVRIVQKIDESKSRTRHAGPVIANLLGHVTVGYGLIMVVAAAGVASLAALLAGGSGD